MNAVIVFNELDKITYQDKIYKTVSRYIKNDYKENLSHKVALILLMFLLNKYNFDINRVMKSYKYDKNNIPTANVHFSNSYSDNYVVSSISDQLIGVDVEKKADYDLDILNEKELNEYNILILTRKEAYGKYLKLGLHYDYKSIDLSSNSNFFKRYGCYFHSFQDDNAIISTCGNFNNIEYIKITCNALEQFIDKLL